jgi:hypothetical protein
MRSTVGRISLQGNDLRLLLRTEVANYDGSRFAAHLASGGTKMKKLQLNPEHLCVESFPVQNVPGEERGTTLTGPTGLPYTCPECPYTRNVLCY